MYHIKLVEKAYYRGYNYDSEKRTALLNDQIGKHYFVVKGIKNIHK